HAPILVHPGDEDRIRSTRYLIPDTWYPPSERPMSGGHHHHHHHPELKDINWLKPASVGLIGVHLAALMVFFVPFAWKWVALCFALYFVRMFGITGGYHRYFSHRSFKTGRTFQFLLALFGITSMQKGPLWWGAVHRHHHQHSDEEPD